MYKKQFFIEIFDRNVMSEKFKDSVLNRRFLFSFYWFMPFYFQIGRASGEEMYQDYDYDSEGDHLHQDQHARPP